VSQKLTAEECARQADDFGVRAEAIDQEGREVSMQQTLEVRAHARELSIYAQFGFERADVLNLSVCKANLSVRPKPQQGPTSLLPILGMNIVSR
jgi:hypothetical protein